MRMQKMQKMQCMGKNHTQSPQSHELFPEAARKRAVEVMRLGYLVAWDEERFDSREGAAPELADIWRGFVLPRVVVR